jgi:hypothetical protein
MLNNRYNYYCDEETCEECYYRYRCYTCGNIAIPTTINEFLAANFKSQTYKSFIILYTPTENCDITLFKRVDIVQEVLYRRTRLKN